MDWTIYLIHFDAPDIRARHYLGITKTDRVERRWQEHAAGRGASLTRRVALTGTPLQIARLWHPADYGLERRLKQRGHAAELCPICHGADPLRTIAPTIPTTEQMRTTNHWTATGWA